MQLLLPLLIVSALVSPRAPTPSQDSASASCSSWRQCREMAVSAHEEKDEERFHDLAWRAVQTRGRRDPELLFLLARAQSASGRPDDALVTLRRLATEHGVARDVEDDEDFRRVRALPGWPDVQALIARISDGAAASAASEAPSPGEAAAASPSRSSEAPVSMSGTGGTVPVPRATGDEVARFAAPRFAPGGLAYDEVSRRFVIGNLPERKLTIVAQDTNRAATLSGDAARLLGVRAIDIDRRTGDLWVVSSAPERGGSGRSSELHRLQLISGRVLHVYSPEQNGAAARFVDVAVAPGRGVLVLDAEGPRLLRPMPDGRSIARVMDLPPGAAASLAPADDGRTVYVAYDDRIERVDLATRASAVLQRNGRTEPGGFTRLRWHRGALLGVQERGGATHVMRLRLGRTGGIITGAETLASIEGTGAPVTLDVLGNDLYYLVAGAPEAVIRRVRLR